MTCARGKTVARTSQQGVPWIGREGLRYPVGHASDGLRTCLPNTKYQVFPGRCRYPAYT